MLLARQGSAGTDFSLVDGGVLGQPFGTVAGRDLTCAAARTILVCADPVGAIRAWQMPIATAPTAAG